MQTYRLAMAFGELFPVWGSCRAELRGSPGIPWGFASVVIVEKRLYVRCYNDLFTQAEMLQSHVTTVIVSFGWALSTENISQCIFVQWDGYLVTQMLFNLLPLLLIITSFRLSENGNLGYSLSYLQNFHGLMSNRLRLLCYYSWGT